MELVWKHFLESVTGPHRSKIVFAKLEWKNHVCDFRLCRFASNYVLQKEKDREKKEKDKEDCGNLAVSFRFPSQLPTCNVVGVGEQFRTTEQIRAETAG